MKIAEGSTHGKRIAEGSTCELIVVEASNGAVLFQRDSCIAIHIDDIPELIKELERISKGEVIIKKTRSVGMSEFGSGYIK